MPHPNATITITLDPNTSATLQRIADNIEAAKQLLAQNEELLSVAIANGLKAEIPEKALNPNQPL